MEQKVTKEVWKFGMQNDLHDPCSFTWRLRAEGAILILYVDNMLILSNDLAKLDRIKVHLYRVLQIKDLGEP